MTAVRFTKAIACGNDFLVIEAAPAPTDVHSFTRNICNRYQGIGADGVEWISPGSGNHDVVARLINSDGSEAEVSGNGTRCVAAYWIRRNGGDNVRVLTGAGVKLCRLINAKEDTFHFEMNMGEPQISGSKQVSGVEGTVVSMGNPHFAVAVPGFGFNWEALGAEIQASGHFPQGTNVEFVKVIDRHTIETRFFERGAGATQSSGTGSCAATVAAIHRGSVESPVKVVAQGGTQVVRWEKTVHLAGPAQIIGEGEYSA